MGFVIPHNWNYDQYATVNMGSNNEWAIDKDAYSGMFPPVTSLNTYVYTQPAKPIRTNPTKIGALADIIQDLETLEDLYVAWYTPLYQAAPNVLPPLSATVLATGITRFLRSGVYNNTLWQVTLRASDAGFISYVQNQNMPLYQRLYNYLIYERDGGYIVSDGQGGFINLKHIAAAAEGYFSSSILPDSWYGWIGDLASVVANAERYVNDHGCSYQEAADIVVGDDAYDYSHIDICADADAIKIAELIAESTSCTHSFSESLYDYYNNYAENRFLFLLGDIGCKANLTDIRTKLNSKLGLVAAEAAFYLGTQIQNPPADITDLINRLSNFPSSAARTACCASFANYLYCEME